MKFVRSVLLALLLLSLGGIRVKAQFIYGTSGLMHLPTAEMQEDKTFMTGWNWLDVQAMPKAENYGWDKEPSMNYYANVTILPWFEIGYTCTLIRGKYLSKAYGFGPEGFRKWANQDRHFDFRLRLWKEGWWKWWTPQIVVGINDALHTFSQVGSGNIGTSDAGNGYWGRTYIAAYKHIDINKVGTVKAHLAYLYNNREDFHFKGLGVGSELQFDGIQSGNHVADKLLHELSVMAEYDTRTFNMGARYNIPLLMNEYGHEMVTMHLACELLAMKYFSGGVYFKVHLR